MKRGAGGFTLLEALVVLAVLGILVSIAVPSFSYLAASTKLKTARTDLYIALLKARSEAIKRDTTVTLTPKSGQWENGWEMRTAGGDLLADRTALPGVDITLGPDSVTYLGSGRIQTAVGVDRVRFNIGPLDIRNFSLSDARCVTVQANGSPYLKPEKDGGCS